MNAKTSAIFPWFLLRSGCESACLVLTFLLPLFLCGCARSEVTAQQAPPAPPLTFIGEWVTHGDGPGKLNHPEWIATDSAGNVFVADSGSGDIHKFGADGHPLLSFNEGVPREAFRVAVDAGEAIYVLAPNVNSLFLYSPEGEPFRHYALAPQRGHQRPESVAVDDSGDIFVIVDLSGGRGQDNAGRREIREYNSRGRYRKTLTVADTSGSKFVPASLGAGPDGYVYVLDVTGDRVQKFSGDGDYSAGWSTPIPAGAPAGADSTGLGIAVNSKYVFAADTENRGVRVWMLDGQDKLTDDLGGRLQGSSSQYQIAVNRRGELFVLDLAGGRILRFRINF